MKDNIEKQHSPTNKAIGSILTDIHDWWKSISKFVRRIVSWFVLIWALFLTFTAAGGYIIINKVIDNLFPEKNSLEISCRIEDRNNILELICGNGSAGSGLENLSNTDESPNKNKTLDEKHKSDTSDGINEQ